MKKIEADEGDTFCETSAADVTEVSLCLSYIIVGNW